MVRVGLCSIYRGTRDTLAAGAPCTHNVFPVHIRYSSERPVTPIYARDISLRVAEWRELVLTSKLCRHDRELFLRAEAHKRESR
jgi:hypothetical protein